MLSSRRFPTAVALIFALTLAFAPLNPKIGGLTWLIYASLGGWLGLKGLFKLQSQDGLTDLSVVEHAARIWLLTCVMATLLRVIPHAFWQDDWGRRHAEARLLLGALAGLALVKWSSPYKMDFAQRKWLGHALALACVMGFGLTAVVGRETPLHPIAWAVALSFLVCLLAPMTLDPAAGNRNRKIWLVAVVLGLLGVLLSQSRGAFGLLILLLFGGFTVLSSRIYARQALLSRSSLYFFLALCMCILLLSLVDPYWLKNLIHRIAEAWGEAALSSGNMGQAANTSIGTRLYLWSKALDAIELRPWLGYGKENTINMIQAWGVEINSTQILQLGLGHLHNEFLDAWTSHGLLGLMSLLILMLGLGLTAKVLWVPHPIAAKGLVGILFMHVTAGLSNVNMAHNYYGAMLSLSVGIALLLAASETPQDASSP